MGYMNTLRPGLDAPISIPPLQLTTPVTVSLSGFIGLHGHVTAFSNGGDLRAVRIHIQPITLGTAIKNFVLAHVSDIKWDDTNGYVLEVNNTTEVAYGYGPVG